MEHVLHTIVKVSGKICHGIKKQYNSKFILYNSNEKMTSIK